MPVRDDLLSQGYQVAYKDVTDTVFVRPDVWGTGGARRDCLSARLCGGGPSWQAAVLWLSEPSTPGRWWGIKRGSAFRSGLGRVLSSSPQPRRNRASGQDKSAGSAFRRSGLGRVLSSCRWMSRDRAPGQRSVSGHETTLG